jgi:hypothetical protein
VLKELLLCGSAFCGFAIGICEARREAITVLLLRLHAGIFGVVQRAYRFTKSPQQSLIACQ